MSTPTTPDPAQLLEEAGEALGQRLAALPPEKKRVVQEIRDGIQQEFEAQQAAGQYLDRSAFMAAALIGHPDLDDADLHRAAAAYVEADRDYLRSLGSLGSLGS